MDSTGHLAENLISVAAGLASEGRGERRVSQGQNFQSQADNTQSSIKHTAERSHHIQQTEQGHHPSQNNGECPASDSDKSGESTGRGSRARTEPDVGAEAPQPSSEDGPEVEEAIDDVEFPETVVLVGKTHWRCVSCMEHFSRAISIDDHVSTHHSQPAFPPAAASVPKRGRGRRGRGTARGKAPAPKPQSSHLQIEQKPQRASLRQVESAEEERVGLQRHATGLGKGTLQRGRGRGSRGSRGGRGRGRGRGRVFTRPLTSEDSDIEIDGTATSPLQKVSGKRKAGPSAGLGADESSGLLQPVTKVPRNADDDFTNAENDLPNANDSFPAGVAEFESSPPSPGPDVQEMTKDVMKEKYVVMVEKAKAVGDSSECESHMESDPPLPIVIPSLHADSLLPPATPVLPDIHGPPETPILPDHDTAAHHPEMQHSFQQHDMSGIVGYHVLDPKEHAATQEFLLPGMISALSSEPFSKTKDEVGAEAVPAPGGDGTSSGGLEMDSSKHTCQTCGEDVEGNISDLMNHYCVAHGQYLCTECQELYTDLTEYEGHKMTHTSGTDRDIVTHTLSVDSDISIPEVYTCPVRGCFQACVDKETLMDHISWHEDRDLDEEQLNALPCHLCAEIFQDSIALQRHLVEMHSIPGLTPFSCELCQKPFGSRLELRQHNDLQHAGIRRYGCAYCDERFEFRSSHRQHVASEHDVAATVLRM